MINFNSKNVNEQILCIAEQFNSEQPDKQLALEKIKSSYNYGEYIEHSRLGILYNEDLEELMKVIGYTIIEEKRYSHSVKITLKAITENDSYTGFGFIIPGRYHRCNTSELFIDFNTFSKK